MMKNIILLVLLGVALIAAFKPVLDDAPIKTQFEEFQKKYNKVYTSDEERTLRYKNFKESLIRSSKRNAASPKATFGITKFSDLSEEEFQSTVLMRNKITPSKPVGVKKNTLITPPESFDWRDKGAVTAVKNQEQCGSCWAFSTTENVESMWILSGKADDTIALSPQQIVDCDTGDDGCGGGEPTNAYAYLMGAGGLESESDYPYVGEDGNCSFNSKDVVASISNWVYATEWLDETTLQQSLLTMGPLSICVDASSWQDYQNGIMTWSECAYVNFLDHCVQLVGYNSTDTNNQYWMVRNSWADNWGVDGYIWLQMWEDTCGITYEATCSQI